MQILISCAKTMATADAGIVPAASQPLFADVADRLAAQLAALSAEELGRLLRVNARLAAENRRRYLAFHDAPQLAAITAYTGIVLKRIDPQSFSSEDFAWAQEHLNITSFLYGLLRPLDAIRPYRLEGDAMLPAAGERTLFEFWRERLTETLMERVRQDDGVLVNLASGEMKRLFDWPRVVREVRVITPEFRVREGERLKTVVVYAKMCRGEMTRRILRERITDPEALRDFEWEGFRFDSGSSLNDQPCFVLQ